MFDSIKRATAKNAAFTYSPRTNNVVQALRLECISGSKVLPEHTLTPLPMQAAEFEWGWPARVWNRFKQHQFLSGSRTNGYQSYVTEVWAHGRCHDVFIFSPEKIPLERYRDLLKFMFTGVAFHNRDPGLVELTKGGTAFGNVWLDLNRETIFCLDPEVAKALPGFFETELTFRDFAPLRAVA